MRETLPTVVYDEKLKKWVLKGDKSKVCKYWSENDQSCTGLFKPHTCLNPNESCNYYKPKGSG